MLKSDAFYADLPNDKVLSVRQNDENEALTVNFLND